MDNWFVENDFCTKCKNCREDKYELNNLYKYSCNLISYPIRFKQRKDLHSVYQMYLNTWHVTIDKNIKNCPAYNKMEILRKISKL